MENQHRQIKGYRELSQEEIDLMNEIKQKGAELGGLIQILQKSQKAEVETIRSADENFTEKAESVQEAMRWTSIAKTDLQRGLMALTRAVARPTFF